MTAVEAHVLPRAENLACGCIVHINAAEVSVRPCRLGCVNYRHIMNDAVERKDSK